MGGNQVYGTTNSTGLSPDTERTFTAVAVGTNIKVYIGGALCIDANSSFFDDIAGSVGYQTSATCYFDDMTVFY